TMLRPGNKKKRRILMLDQLPSVILARVFSYLNQQTLLECMLVCKSWHTLILSEPQCWRSLRICTSDLTDALVGQLCTGVCPGLVRLEIYSADWPEPPQQPGLDRNARKALVRRLFKSSESLKSFSLRLSCSRHSNAIKTSRSGSVGGGSGGGTSVDWLSPDTILSQLARKGGRASTLHSLTLRAERLTDSGVKKLTGGAGCAQLRRLHLTACHRLTDSALAGLTASAPLLHCLHIVDCPLISERGLQRLSSGRGKDGGNAACCLRELTFAGQHRLADQAKAARVIGDIGSCLERLSLDSCSPHCTLSCDQSMLGGFQCLTQLRLTALCFIGDPGLAVLAKCCPGLRILELLCGPTNHCITDLGAAVLASVAVSHRTAAAASAAVSPSAAESTGLQELTLPCNLLTPKGYHSLGSLGPGLAKLCLRYCSAGADRGMATMPLSLTGLRHLEATASARCGGEEAALFAGLEMTRLVECCASNLRILRVVSNCDQHGAGGGGGNGSVGLGPAALAKAAALLSLAELRELTLCPCDSLTETCVAQLLRACPQLRHVSLGPDIKVSQVSIRLMIRDTNLSIVRPLIGWYLRSDTICYRDLLHLELIQAIRPERFCFITDNLLTFIGQRCPSLRLLRLEPCTLVTDQGIRMLAPCRRLQRLHLSGCEQLTDEALRAIEESPGSRNLKVLVLEGCSRIENSRKAAERLQKSLVRLDQCLLRQDSGTGDCAQCCLL
ncbi:hypothetical protein BOX15_Mlig021035g1, partial [Macrostomum lignano]